jgi:hypothetical protein
MSADRRDTRSSARWSPQYATSESLAFDARFFRKLAAQREGEARQTCLRIAEAAISELIRRAEVADASDVTAAGLSARPALRRCAFGEGSHA